MTAVRNHGVALKTLLLSVVLAVSTAWLDVVHAQASGAGQPVPVIVAPAKRAELVDRVEALGTTRANETVRLTASVTEIVQQVLFDDGQTVDAGDVLVMLNKAEEEADLRAAEAILTERQLAFQRAQELESRQFTTTAQLDERRAALLEAEAAIEAVRARIANRVIRAPFGGIVGFRDISPGALVEPGDVITTLDDLSVIKLDLSVPAVFLPTLTRGLAIVAKARALDNRTFNGTVSSIDSRVDPVTRSITVRALIPNTDGTLKPGLLMTTDLLKSAREGIVIPEEALIPQGRSIHVLVVDPDTNVATRRDVEIGLRRPGSVEVLSGLEEGELVITHGTLKVRPGQTVTIQEIDNGEEQLSQRLGGLVNG